MTHNKTRILTVLLIVLILISLPIFLIMANERNSIQGPSDDALRFVYEHERLNNTYRDNGEPYLNITIPVNNTVVYVSFDELKALMNYGTGVFFFGRPMCPSCRPIFPDFIQIAIDMGITLHYYYYMSQDRDEHNSNYVALLERLHEYLPVNDRDQTPGEPGFDPNMKRITVPHIFVVQNGEVIAHEMLNRHPYIAAGNIEGIRGIISNLLSQYNPG